MENPRNAALGCGSWRSMELVPHCAEDLKQEGHGVYVEGRLQIREYEDKEEVERLVEVVASKVRFLFQRRAAAME